jgi:hypothetical protein
LHRPVRHGRDAAPAGHQLQDRHGQFGVAVEPCARRRQFLTALSRVWVTQFVPSAAHPGLTLDNMPKLS